MIKKSSIVQQQQQQKQQHYLRIVLNKPVNGVWMYANNCNNSVMCCWSVVCSPQVAVLHCTPFRLWLDLHLLQVFVGGVFIAMVLHLAKVTFLWCQHGVDLLRETQDSNYYKPKKVHEQGLPQQLRGQLGGQKFNQKPLPLSSLAVNCLLWGKIFIQEECTFDQLKQLDRDVDRDAKTLSSVC